MEWVWELFKKPIMKQLAVEGRENPDQGEVQRAFMKVLCESTVTVLVQEPWQNSVRFRTLAKYDWEGMKPLIADPMQYLADRFGGGKFKLNFHHGWNFIATQNFKPEGQPKWKAFAEVDHSS